MRRAVLIFGAICHLLLGGCFLAAATFFFRAQAYSITGILALAGVVCIFIGIDTVKEQLNEQQGR